MAAKNLLARRSLARRISDNFWMAWSVVAGNALLLGLALAATLLLTLFFVGLNRLEPSSPGDPVRLDTARELIDSKDKQVAMATLRDQDARLELRLFDGRQ